MDIDELLHALYHEPDLEKRKYIPDKLAKLGDWQSTEPLGKLIISDDQPEEMRDEAVESLGKQGDPKAIPYLKQVLDDPDEDLRRTAVWSLGQIGTAPTLDIVFTMTDDEDEDVRRWVAKSAGRIRNDAVISYLERYYEDIEPENDQRVLADILRAVTDQLKRTEPPQITYWSQSCHSLLEMELQGFVKQAAMRLLNKCFEYGIDPDVSFLEGLLDELPESDPLVRPEVILGLGHAGAVDLLIPLDDIVSIEALGLAGATDELHELLPKTTENQRLISVLKAFCHSEALPELETYLDHENLTVRLQAMELHARREQPMDPLFEQFESGEGRHKLLEIFRFYGPKALDILETGALEMNKVARQNSVYSLISEEMLRHQEVHERIYNILKQVNENDKIWHIRRDARIGMEKISNMNSDKAFH